jgi:5-methylcytosine-specific restriction protein A
VTIKPPSCCRTPTCGGHAVERGYCAECIAANPAVIARIENKQPYRHLYLTSRWRNKLSPAIIYRDPVCKICNHNPSTVADHKQDHKGNEQLFFDPTNLQGICKPCHDFKTGSTHRGQRKNPGDKPYLIGGKICDPTEELARQEGSRRRKP